MNEYRKQYLDALTKRACEVMSNGSFSRQDIDFLLLYKSELRRLEYIPKLKRIIGGAQEVLAFMKDLNKTKEPDATNTEINPMENDDDGNRI